MINKGYWMHIADNSVPEPNIVLDLLEAFRRSKTMFAAVELGVFDALDQPRSLDELVAQLNCHRMALMTLLNSCVALGLLNKQEDLYSNSPVATTYLTKESPRRMTGYIHYSNRVMWQMWSHLEDAVRDGSHRWKQTFGFEGPIFSHFFETEEAMHEFLMGMHGFGMITSPSIVNAFDLSRFKVLADLGGATGHLVIAACQRYPQLQGIVFDLPHALELARTMVSQSQLQSRIQIVGGDFFIDPLPPADLYALGRIIHDWSEDKIDRLLGRIYEALPSGGGLLIGEKILWEDGVGPRWALMQSLNMIVCTEGRERTLSEYGKLLDKAGFRYAEGVRTQVPLDGILAIKP
jgi:acetylserotonin N-methyltransferase